MHNSYYIYLTMLATLVTTGCANLSPASSANTLESGKNYWINYDASRRGTLVLVEGQKIKSCAEPAPDVALSFLNTFKGNLNTPNGASATNIDTALNATVQALAGRDETVLLAREALFRICEASINGSIAPGDVKPLFKEVFFYTADIAKAQAEAAKSKAIQAEVDMQKAKIKSEFFSK